MCQIREVHFAKLPNLWAKSSLPQRSMVAYKAISQRDPNFPTDKEEKMLKSNNKGGTKYCCLA